MAKFCGKCGAKLDESIRFCPNCGNAVNANPREKKTEISEVDKKTVKSEKKKLKNETKKVKKKEKLSNLTFKYRAKRFFIKLIAILLALIIVASTCVGALVYYDFVDIPVASDIMKLLGIMDDEEDTDNFNSISGKFTDILVVDEESAIEAAREAALQMGLGNAADELSVKNVSTVGDLTYYRLQQNYQGIPVYGKSIVIVVDDTNQSVSATSNLVDIDVSEKSRVSHSKIESNVKEYLIENDIIDDKTIVKLTGFDNNIIYSDNDNVSLAYILNIFFGDSPISFYEAIVDVETGKIFSLTETVLEDTVECFNSDRSITVSGNYDDSSDEYQLHDIGRGVFIYSYNNTDSRSNSANQIFITSDNEVFGDTKQEQNLEQNKSIIFLKNISKIYDFYYNAFNEDGYENTYCYYNDAYDSGENALGGNATVNRGITVGYLSMGSVIGVEDLDTMAHEYTHIISRKIVSWVNIPAWVKQTNEPGAINEGYSDLFGEIIEASINNTDPDWEHGSRIIHDPMSQGYPAKVTDKKLKRFRGSMWGMNTQGRSYTDYSHGFSTVISHCAYLMNNGVNDTNVKINLNDLSNLWYHTLLIIPSDCTFVLLREYMELTADNLGFTEEQQQCISAAFDEIGIKSQSAEETYSPESTLSVKDRNGESYDDYNVKITGEKYRGLIKTGLWKEDYSNEFTVTDADPVSLNLTRGNYKITVTDNFSDGKQVTKSVKIRGGSDKKEIVVASNFGFDYIIKTEAKLNVYDMNDQLYSNYSVEIDGTYTENENVQSYSDNFTSDASGQNNITLSEGKYSFLLTDGKDDKKTKSFTVRVKASGTDILNVSTAFGNKAGQFDSSDVLDGAVMFNNHWYKLIVSDSVSDWHSAKLYCENMNGYLATITSKEENDFLYNYVKNESGHENAYFGFTDELFEGTWKWVNGEKVDYTNWASGEPNSENQSEDSAMFYYKFQDGTWNDAGFGKSTSNGESVFICEWGEYVPEKAEKEISSQPTRKTSDERDIVLVLDVSGSMSGTPLTETKKAATKFINTILKEDASIGIVSYSNSASVLSDFSMDEEKLTGIVSGLSSGGSTNIDGGLTKANELLQYSNAEKKIIVLMSDGEPNVGREGDDLVSFADSIKDNGTYIYTLGFFASVSGSKSAPQLLMERIASEGCHYEVANADDLVFFFGDIADKINGQKYIYVRIACPVEVTVTYQGETLSSAQEDFNGRTSYGSLTLEDIANSDDKIKTLRLKEGQDYKIHIQGTARGKMDYTIGYMDDSGEYSDMRTFEDITITRRTLIDSSTKYSERTVLKVDEDGDGRYDVKYRAGVNGQGKLVDYTYVLYIAISVVVLIVILVVMKKIKNGKKRKAVKYG